MSFNPKNVVTITAIVDGRSVETRMCVAGGDRSNGEAFIPVDFLSFDYFKATDLRIDGRSVRQIWCNEGLTLPTIVAVRGT